MKPAGPRGKRPHVEVAQTHTEVDPDLAMLLQMATLCTVRRLQSEIELQAARRLVERAREATEAARAELRQQLEQARRQRREALEKHLGAPQAVQAVRAWRQRELQARDDIARCRGRLGEQEEQLRQADEALRRQAATTLAAILREEKTSAAIELLEESSGGG